MIELVFLAVVVALGAVLSVILISFIIYEILYSNNK